MTWFYAAAAVVAAGLQYKNTQDTARRQDNQAATSILNQSRIQKRADNAVNDEVKKLQGSNSADEADARLNDYLGTLRRNRASMEEGLTPNIGSAAFRADAGDAAAGLQDYASRTAGLLSRIDAPQLQRQGEAFGYGNLASNIQGIGRESQGQSFIDQLKLNAIRRNAKMDLASGLLSAYAGAGLGSGASMADAASTNGAGFGINGAGNASKYAGYV